MKWFSGTFAVVLLIVSLAVFGCSKEKTSKKEEAAKPSVQQQATEAIQEYGRKPVGEARKTQTMGDDRTEAIDAVTGNLDRR
ncbi:MAG: hypothetical protein ABFD97_06675 [Syntrophobacter sp.]